MSGASERANGGANGPILYASISLSFNPPWIGNQDGVGLSAGRWFGGFVGFKVRGWLAALLVILIVCFVGRMGTRLGRW